METVTRVLATTSEISLKRGNRAWFERALTDNVRKAIEDLPVADVSRPSWRVLIRFSEAVPWTEVARRLATVFGLGAVMPIELEASSLDEVADRIHEVVSPRARCRFAVRCLRSDKRFPTTSPEVERRLGRVIQQLTGWPVDLGSPELTVHILIEEQGLYVWTRRIDGPGGLPTGVGGRATCMISGGIDSPVAGWMVMKRGVRLDFVHFHSMPRTDSASIQKVDELVRVLVRYQGPANLVTIPLLEIQEEIAARCPAQLRVLLYRRFMMRLAERVARRGESNALVTGESLGQVASQTIENIRTVGAVAELPVLRPLIGLDKAQIIDLGRRIGTYEISILPHADSCELLMPDRPATRSSPSEVADAEGSLDAERLTGSALAAAERSRIDQPMPWAEIPVSAEAQ